ncbi:MAG TPA: PfkB family carbohydrate kinase, partial [Candidatus Binatia bacterium]|nr:PfkB family carbohydrate kinase [Candidatus Binatia bacterium]
TTDWDEAVAAVRERCEVAALTRSEKGSVIVGDSQTVPVPAAHVERVVDTTGAGDLYSSGFLYGVTHGADLAECGRLGSVCAAEVISHFGARPETSLRSLAGVEA